MLRIPVIPEGHVKEILCEFLRLSAVKLKVIDELHFLYGPACDIEILVQLFLSYLSHNPSWGYQPIYKVFPDQEIKSSSLRFFCRLFLRLFLSSHRHRPSHCQGYDPKLVFHLSYLQWVILYLLKIFLAQHYQKRSSHRYLQRPASQHPCPLVFCVFFRSFHFSSRFECFRHVSGALCPSLCRSQPSFLCPLSSKENRLLSAWR